MHRLIDLKMSMQNILCVISVAALVAIVKQCLFLSLFCALQQKEYLFISVNCNTEFWSLSSDSLCGYKIPRDSLFFGTGSQWFCTGTHDFSQDESWTHHNYLKQNRYQLKVIAHCIAHFFVLKCEFFLQRSLVQWTVFFCFARIYPYQSHRNTEQQYQVFFLNCYVLLALFLLCKCRLFPDLPGTV